MHLPELEVHRIIDTPASLVWDLLIDTLRWVEWGPSIRAVECPDRFIRGGSHGRVRTVLGVWAPFAVTAFRPGFYWSWQVLGLQATGHRVDPLSGGRCRLTFTVPTVAGPYVGVCQVAMRRIERLALEERSAEAQSRVAGEV